MAGVRVGFTSAQCPTGTAAKTILQIVCAANHRALVKRLCISFEGVSTTGTPIMVELLYQSDAGTTPGSAPTGKKINAGDNETIITTFQAGSAATWAVEPSAGDIIFSCLVHPQRSKELILPGMDVPIITSGRLGVRVTADASIDCIVSGELEE